MGEKIKMDSKQQNGKKNKVAVFLLANRRSQRFELSQKARAARDGYLRWSRVVSQSGISHR